MYLTYIVKIDIVSLVFALIVNENCIECIENGGAKEPIKRRNRAIESA